MLVRSDIILFLIYFCSSVLAFKLELKCDERVVKGASVHCLASVYDGDHLAGDKFEYQWKDNDAPQHRKTETNGNSTNSWIISYNDTDLVPGSYVVRVSVCHWEFFGVYCNPVGSTGTFIEITDTLNGKINITQGNETRANHFVSTHGTALHNIDLQRSDADYIENAPTVLSYWFVDCVYYGLTNDLQFSFNYSKPDESHIIEALVLADFTPIPTTTLPPPTSTTTTTTTTGKPTSTSTSKPTSATVKSTSTTAITKANDKHRRSINPLAASKNESAHIMVKVNNTLVLYNGSFPYVCGSTLVVTSSNKVYGYFKQQIVVKAPVTNVNVSGNNWLQHGELLSLDVKCKGSQRMQYCIRFIRGTYNVTGKETCGDNYMDLDNCDFPIKRYLPDSMKHTVLIIIKNDVSHVVTPVTITVYQVKLQAQLSVIVVPVAFSLVAVVLIVFGVAYYFQNRSRFVIEVADFDFGQQYADMEYKTFKDRLKDSIVNAFTRDPIPSTSDISAWPPGHKYGSMT